MLCGQYVTVMYVNGSGEKVVEMYIICRLRVVYIFVGIVLCILCVFCRQSGYGSLVRLSLSGSVVLEATSTSPPACPLSVSAPPE